APLMRPGEQPRQEPRHGRRADDHEVGGTLRHAAAGPATLGPCGNASGSIPRVLVVFRRIRLIEGAVLPRQADKRVRPMIFWLLAIAVTAIACAALLYAAAGAPVNATGPDAVAANGPFRQLLAGIEADQAAGKLGEAEALAAKGELAREMLRTRAERRAPGTGEVGRGTVIGGLMAVIAVAFGLYAFLGSPDLPTQPLAERPEALAQHMDIDAAIARIETALAADPDDVQGWTVIAPAYVERGRYGDAADAYRRAIALGGASAVLQTGLAEALLLEANGAGSAEAMELLRQAAASDPSHA